ncbi:MAG: cupin domain-containing protein [Clostridiaceae bacterium]|jgi:quercetin dioxygenase-like cupin family protein|nr:cupin domain-containing protein [Clostridiaceae bacterium]
MTFAKKVLNLKNSIDYQENSIVSKTITDNTDSSLTLFAFDKGQSIAPHSAPVDAVVQAVEGEVEVMISGENYTLKEGEIILMPKGEPHGLTAKSKFKMALFKV